MAERVVTTIIDPEKCNGCGLCIKVCPSETISLIHGTACVTGEKSLSCGHCMAVCPQSAIVVEGIDPDSILLKTMEIKKDWLAPGKTDINEFARIMASRRSCRNYKKKAVGRHVIEDLVKLGMLAPSGTNSQQWTFTCLPERQQVEKLATLIGHFFRRLNRTAEKGFLRKLLSIMGKNALEHYYREYYETVQQAITDMAATGRDRLFHGATACIIVGSKPGASCPMEDAMLATGNILLASHAMGLGTCLIGFAVEAMKRDTAIQEQMGIPGDEKLISVIALGYPDENYQRITGRKKTTVRFVS